MSHPRKRITGTGIPKGSVLGCQVDLGTDRAVTSFAEQQRSPSLLNQFNIFVFKDSCICWSRSYAHGLSPLIFVATVMPEQYAMKGYAIEHATHYIDPSFDKTFLSLTASCGAVRWPGHAVLRARSQTIGLLKWCILSTFMGPRSGYRVHHKFVVYEHRSLSNTAVAAMAGV